MCSVCYGFYGEVCQRWKLLKIYSVYKPNPGENPIPGQIGHWERSKDKVLQSLQKLHGRPYDLGHLWAAKYALVLDFDKYYDCGHLGGDDCTSQFFQVLDRLLVEHYTCMAIVIGPSGLDWVSCVWDIWFWLGLLYVLGYNARVLVVGFTCDGSLGNSVWVLEKMPQDAMLFQKSGSGSSMHCNSPNYWCTRNLWCNVA